MGNDTDGQSIEQKVKMYHEIAQDAANKREPLVLLNALGQDYVLDGLTRQLRVKWSFIPLEDLDDIVAASVDRLYVAICDGTQVTNVMGYLWKTADHKAQEYDRKYKKEKSIGFEQLDMFSTPSPNPSLDAELDQREVMRREAIAIARRLLPKIRSQNIQEVLGYLINAVEIGVEDLPNQQIADALGLSLRTVRDCLYRGLKRLSKLAYEDGVTRESYDFSELYQPIDDDISNSDEE